MNDRFFLLDETRQEQILNSGYKAFAQNTYKKTSMSLVADEARISKSLLFHYFINKKELYLYLYKRAVELINEALSTEFESRNMDFFDLLQIYMKNKIRIFYRNPYLIQFFNRAYYENEEALQTELSTIKEQKIIEPISQFIMNADNEMINTSDKQNLLEVLIYMAEGFAFANNKHITDNPEQAMKEFSRLLNYINKIHN